ncbi:hypothetical protein ACE1B6_24140 [Aerosakkonemataceae cyanobacterium BLCC-F154]|uniref:AP2/ERF domain-containing protein n=1 Tax=Floridaenema fluviatile BLCC-F154 TaxID=3153640 RepID=A0ABV4YHP8_9CYAN
MAHRRGDIKRTRPILQDGECSKCHLIFEKLSDQFLVSHYKQDGSPTYNHICKECRKERRKKAYQKNRDKELATMREWHKNNRKAVNKRHREYRVKNPHIFNAKTGRRRLSVTAATNIYELNSIKAFYSHAQDMTKVTGVKYVVDHIDPVNHHLVCGLNYPANLRVIPEEENGLKSNKFKPYGFSRELGYYAIAVDDQELSVMLDNWLKYEETQTDLQNKKLAQAKTVKKLKNEIKRTNREPKKKARKADAKNKYKGVNEYSKGGYKARMQVKNKEVCFGYFQDELTAAKAYNIGSRLLLGDGVYQNDLPDENLPLDTLEKIANKVNKAKVKLGLIDHSLTA